MDYETMRFKARFYFENIPYTMRNVAKREFIRVRDEAATIFNDCIDEVNSEYDLTGKKAYLGEDPTGDFNPEYVQFIINRIQPKIDALVNSKEAFCEVYIGENGDLYGRVKKIEGSKITLRLDVY